MKLTRERKMYAGLFVLAVVALGVDKFVLGPPQTQAAAQAQAPEPQRPAAHAEPQGQAAVAAGAKQPGLAALTLQMDHVSRAMGLDAKELPDVFQPPAGWVKPAAPKPQADVAAIFAAQHHLLAVLKSSHGGIAVIGGATSRKSLRIGQKVDGFELAAIGERSVTFASGTQKIELQLPTDSSADSQIISSTGR
jgi:hypothetical protein